MNAIEKSPYFDICDALICPLDENKENAIWYSDKEGKLFYVFTNVIIRDNFSFGTKHEFTKDMQDNNSEYMECLFQIMSIFIISLPFKEEKNDNKGVILEHDTHLEQQKIPFKVITGLNFRNKESCSKPKFLFENLREEGGQESGQGSGQGSSEGVPQKIFHKKRFFKKSKSFIQGQKQKRRF